MKTPYSSRCVAALSRKRPNKTQDVPITYSCTPSLCGHKTPWRLFWISCAPRYQSSCNGVMSDDFCRDEGLPVLLLRPVAASLSLLSVLTTKPARSSADGGLSLLLSTPDFGVNIPDPRPRRLDPSLLNLSWETWNHRMITRIRTAAKDLDAGVVGQGC